MLDVIAIIFYIMPINIINHRYPYPGLFTVGFAYQVRSQRLGPRVSQPQWIFGSLGSGEFWCQIHGEDLKIGRFPMGDAQVTMVVSI